MAHAHLEDVSEAGVLHEALCEAEVRREESRRVRHQLAARFDCRSLENLGVVLRDGDGSFYERPLVALQRRHRHPHVLGRGKGHVDEIDVGIVEHVFHAPVRAHVGEILFH